MSICELKNEIISKHDVGLHCKELMDNSIPSTDTNTMDTERSPASQMFVPSADANAMDAVKSPIPETLVIPTPNLLTPQSKKNKAELMAKETKSTPHGAPLGDGNSNSDSSSHKTDSRNLCNDKEANPCAKEKEKVKPAFYFPDGSILKALLMSPLSFKNKIRNGIYQNGAYSTFPPESKITTFVNVKTEPFDFDDQSNSISPTVLKKKFKSRKMESGSVATATIKKVNSFIKKFGSEVGVSPNTPTTAGGPTNIKAEPFSQDGSLPSRRMFGDDPLHLANVTHLIKDEVDIEDSRSAMYSDDSNECIPSLNVEVELEEGEGIINSHNIDYFYNGTNFGKDVNNGEIHDINKQELMAGSNKLGMALEDLRCEVCGRQFNFKKNMNKHLRHMHGLGRFRCAVCPLEFEKRRDLIHHRDSHSEGGVAGGGFKCEICGKIIQWYNHFIQHRRTHEFGKVVSSSKRHICSICSKGFRSAANLRVHLRTHTGERPFVCNICGVSFAQKRIQVDHMNKHTGARPYECQECGDKFSNYITYNVHKRTRHSAPDHPNAFACSVCDVSFIWRSNLVSHMRSHTKEKTYACQTCDKSFAHRNSLAYHRRAHAGTRHVGEVRPVECDICGKCFARKSLMRSHRRTHLGKAHVCAECGRTFGSKSTLVRHARMQHPKE